MKIAAIHYFKSFIFNWFGKLKSIITHKNDVSGKYEGYAVGYNDLTHVNHLNKDWNHWLSCRKEDEKFIDCIYKVIVNICMITSGDEIADFGCGTGVLISKLKKEYPKINIMGYDFSEEKVMRCREFYRYDPTCFFKKNIYDPIDERYDVIIATEVLEHLEYPSLAISNLLTALKASGRLFFTVPDGRTDNYHGHIHFWSPESWMLFIDQTVGHCANFKVGMLAGKNYALITLKE